MWWILKRLTPRVILRLSVAYRCCTTGERHLRYGTIARVWGIGQCHDSIHEHLPLDQYFVNFAISRTPLLRRVVRMWCMFTAPTGAPINISMTSEFTGRMYLTKGTCAGEQGIILDDFQSCSTTIGETQSITVDTQAGGDYYPFIEGGREAMGELRVHRELRVKPPIPEPRWVHRHR